jgi:hypothetical protein
MLLGASATEGAPSPECTIKRIISRNGERIYHMENQRFYERIKMNKGSGRRWLSLLKTLNVGKLRDFFGFRSFE